MSGLVLRSIIPAHEDRCQCSVGEMIISKITERGPEKTPSLAWLPIPRALPHLTYSLSHILHNLYVYDFCMANGSGF